MLTGWPGLHGSVKPDVLITFAVRLNVKTKFLVGFVLTKTTFCLNRGNRLFFVMEIYCIFSIIIGMNVLL